MKDLEGKVAFITGGSSGIGLGTVRALLDAGMKVALSYRTLNNDLYILSHAQYEQGIRDRYEALLASKVSL